jgi:hypothetical protein
LGELPDGELAQVEFQSRTEKRAGRGTGGCHGRLFCMSAKRPCG